MRATVVVDVQTRQERRLAERVLKGRGYEVDFAFGMPNRLQVRVHPGEKPEAALRAAGIECKLSAG